MGVLKLILVAAGASAFQTAPGAGRAVAPTLRAAATTEDRGANREAAAEAVGQYCASTVVPARRSTSTVMVGPVAIGSEKPIVLQTMGTTNTNDVDDSVAQILRCQEAGADMVRLTVQGIGEAKNALKIEMSM